MNAHASLGGLMLVALWAMVGCPQLRDDDFEPRSGGVGGSATAGAGGGSGDGGCNAGAGGCGGDAGRGSAGAGGGAGASSLPPADGGTEPDATVVECSPDEVQAPDGACYFVDSTERTWAEARTSCQARGSGWDLMTIGNATQNDLAASLGDFEAWIGATDGVTEGSWSWVDADAPFFEIDVTPTGFTNWSDGEPNDFDGSDCLRILTTGQWADWPCDSPLGSLCGRRPP